GGNNPHLLAEDHVWWQEAGGVFRAPVLTPGASVRVNHRLTPTGFIAIRDGQPVYWDDVAGSQPGMIVSCLAGDYVVGEGVQGGALLRHLPSGRELLLWPGALCFGPTLAVEGDEFAVAVWGGPGVRGAI